MSIRIGDICTPFNGFTPAVTELFPTGKFPYFKVAEMNREANLRIMSDTDLYVRESHKFFPKGAIVFPKNGAAIATNKKRILGQDSIVDLNTAGVKPNSKLVDTYYLFYLFQHIDFVQYMRRGAVPTLDLKSILALEIELPSIPKQQHIVAELDFLSGIIEKKNAQLKTLDELAQSIFYEMFGDPRENELNWKSKAFKDVFKLKSGDGLKEKDFIPGKYPVFGGNGISGYHNAYNKNGEHIIIGRVGAYCGNVRYVNNDFWLTDNAFDAFFNTSEFDYQFVSWLLNILDLHRFANHAAQPVISNTGLRELSIIIPSIDLQTDFANKISAIEHTKKLVTASLETTKQLLNSRMDKYFNV